MAILCSLTCGSQVWKWYEAEQTTVRAMEMNFLRAAVGVTSKEGVRNEEVYGRFR